MPSREPRKRQSLRPTPAQIAAQCASIRARWTEHTYRLRAGVPPLGDSVRVNQVEMGAAARRRATLRDE